MLFLSNLLKEQCPTIFNAIIKQIAINEIPNTKDIWVRDFMPIRSAKGNWILFKYYPKYLRNPKFQHLITDNVRICKELGFDVEYVDIILDGGSVVYKNDLYFVSERIFKDNPQYNTEQLFLSLRELFQTEQIIFIPEAPKDFTGHLDGVLSILDHKTIMINDYQDEYKGRIRNILERYHFNIETLPYNPYSNKTYQSAKGIYINYIQTGKKILLPIFNQKEDEQALAKLQLLFPQYNIVPILCTDLAKQGGLLHCLSWENEA